jgi:DNA topoisomerase-1
VEETADPPKRASLPKDWPPQSVDLERALRLLRLPREVGRHPEDGVMILAGIGRYGPYVQHGRLFANLAGVEEVFDVGLNRAVAVLAEKASGGGRRAAPAVLRELGDHPKTGKPVQILAGRYGPYVRCETVYANLPKGADSETLTLDAAVALLAAGKTAGRGRGKRSARGKPANAKGGTASGKSGRKPATKQTG